MTNHNRFFLVLTLLLFFQISAVSSQDTGVLVLAHGGSEEWNEAVIEAAEPLKKDHKVEVAFGMANYVTMHNGIKKLEKQDVSRIAVVQLFISSYSPIIRQNRYLLGKRDSLPERPMPLMHHIDEYKEMMNIEDDSAGHSSGDHRFYMPENLQPIPTEAEITLAPALDDHPVVAEILNKRIRELSTDPAHETVLLVAHGPNAEDDNEKWIDTMESLSQKIQSAQKEDGTPYKQIFATTVRDDASDEIFNQAKANLRALVRQAGQFGDVVVVPLFLSSGGREQAVAERLEGLDYKWSGKTLLPDPLITDFLRQSVEKAFSQQ
ncbi:Sirohydrochlorin ferrochelatase [Fodinibius roseus]|uniref:Sirohydrochlorin ferrochelatase n=1 Tax=Fodinibius roseus TaxID=1194090 RepID=A0A1M4UW26_9BACT|nr:CbiX/SirB N-terminal domain-containing protein [Fodinibius roseus]SHE60895.1 Sirohydrochlorin ferrochelatase [Fodinibius roseus]